MNINRRMTPNFRRGRNGWEPEIIVIHYDTGNDAGTGTINTIMNPARQASYHFTNGTVTGITQHVEIADTAWANGTSPDSSHRLWNGHASHPVVRSRTANANSYTISVCVPGDRAPVSEERIVSTVALLAYIRNEVHRIYGRWIPIDRAHIVGHNEIARTACPGNFPFDEVIRRLREVAGEAPLPPAPPVVAYSIGDVVQFAGGGVFTSSVAHTPAHTRGASVCRITAAAPRARNQFHLVSTDGGRVHGWVESENIRCLDAEDAQLPCPPPEDAPPETDTPEPGTFVNVAIGGLLLRVAARTSGGRWIMTLPDGPEGQPQPDVIIRVVLETMGLDVDWDGAANTIITAPRNE